MTTPSTGRGRGYAGKSRAHPAKPDHPYRQQNDAFHKRKPIGSVTPEDHSRPDFTTTTKDRDAARRIARELAGDGPMSIGWALKNRPALRFQG